jgi:hypothetical protein
MAHYSRRCLALLSSGVLSRQPLATLAFAAMLGPAGAPWCSAMDVGGHWRDNHGVTFSPDCASFAGRFLSGGSRPETAWTGTRVIGESKLTMAPGSAPSAALGHEAELPPRTGAVPTEAPAATGAGVPTPPTPASTVPEVNRPLLAALPATARVAAVPAKGVDLGLVPRIGPPAPGEQGDSYSIQDFLRMVYEGASWAIENFDREGLRQRVTIAISNVAWAGEYAGNGPRPFTGRAECSWLKAS